jgi:hypothetical protein
MNISLKLLESNQDIYNKILNALLPSVENLMKDVSIKLKQEIPLIVQNSILNAPEYNALLAGQLKYELGIPDANTKVNNLLNYWIANMQITYNKPFINNNQIKSFFSINMIKADFSDVLYQEFGFVTDNERGYSLPWLRWLLLEGNKTLVSNYEVLFGNNRNSRTGFAVMTPSNRSWGVPATYSGTEGDNWITRSLDSVKDQIYSTLEKSLS